VISKDRWFAMRNRAEISFWQNAAQSLPAQVRARYAGYFVAAERWEATLDGFVELFSRSEVKPPLQAKPAQPVHRQPRTT
jgi:hypothetical protein